MTCSISPQGLRDGVGQGQELFQLLIQDSHRAGLGAGAGAQAGEGAGGADGAELMEDSGLEDLRYRWMLYKSKLKEVGDVQPRLTVKVRERGGRYAPRKGQPRGEVDVSESRGTERDVCFMFHVSILQHKICLY